MIVISKQWSFDAAHQLWRNDWTEDANKMEFGKCSRVHGHTYTLEASVAGRIHPDTGMVLNYFILDKIVKPHVEHLDHEFLNDHFDHLTTAELMVHTLGHRIASDLQLRYDDIYLYQVTLQETPKTKAIWRPGE